MYYILYNIYSLYIVYYIYHIVLYIYYIYKINYINKNKNTNKFISYLRVSYSQEGTGMSIQEYNIINIKNIHILLKKKEKKSQIIGTAQQKHGKNTVNQ